MEKVDDRRFLNEDVTRWADRPRRRTVPFGGKAWKDGMRWLIPGKELGDSQAVLSSLTEDPGGICGAALTSYAGREAQCGVVR